MCVISDFASIALRSSMPILSNADIGNIPSNLVLLHELLICSISFSRVSLAPFLSILLMASIAGRWDSPLWYSSSSSTSKQMVSQALLLWCLLDSWKPPMSTTKSSSRALSMWRRNLCPLPTLVWAPSTRPGKSAILIGWSVSYDRMPSWGLIVVTVNDLNNNHTNDLKEVVISYMHSLLFWVWL